MDRKNSDMIEEITTLPDNYVIAEIKDFYKIDYKTKKWIFKVGMEFIVQSFYSGIYEKYIITEEWNDVKYTYINSISDIENNIIIKGLGLNKIQQIDPWIKHKKCFVHKDVKHKKESKPITEKQFNNRIIGKELDF
mgnify:FL=1